MPAPYGLHLRLTHTGSYPVAVRITDVRDELNTPGTFRTAGPLSVPVGGDVLVAYTSQASLSFEVGHIRRHITLGHITASFEVGSETGLGTGGGGSVDVYDEAVLVESEVTSFDFVGDGVVVTSTTPGEVTVTISGTVVDLSGYLTIVSAASTYLTSATAASTYLTVATAASTYQPVDADLTAYAALGTTGWVKRTGAGTVTTETPTAADVGADPTGTAAGLLVDYLTVASASSTYLTSVTAASTYLTSVTAASTYQPLDSDLTAYAGLATTGWVKRTGAGTVETATPTAADVGADPAGTGAAEAAAVYATVTSDLADYLTIASASSTYLTTATAASTYLTSVTAASTYQPLDADLTAYADLATTGWVKRTGAGTVTTSTPTAADVGADPAGTAAALLVSYLTIASASSTYQPLDADLTAVAGGTWTGAGSITTVGTIGSGIWQGTAVGDSYIASAATWNAKEGAITATTSADYYRGDKTFQTLDKTAVGLSNVENTALSTWAGTTSLTTLGTVATGTWGGTPVTYVYGGTGLSALGSPLQVLRTNAGATALEWGSPSGAAGAWSASGITGTVSYLAGFDGSGNPVDVDPSTLTGGGGGGGTSSGGPFASRPASGTTGVPWVSTDGPYTSYWSGSAWQDFVPGEGWVLPPPSTGWSWGNQGSSTVNTVGGTEVVTVEGTSDTVRGRYRTIATTTVEVMVRRFGQDSVLRIGLMESATGKQIFLALIGHQWVLQTMTNYGFTGNLQALVSSSYNAGVVRLRFEVVTTNLVISLSVDGEKWTAFYTGAVTASFTTAPNQFFFGGQAGAVGKWVDVQLLSYVDNGETAGTWTGSSGSGAASGFGLWANRATEVPSPSTGSRYDVSDSELYSVYSGGAWHNIWPGRGEMTLPTGLTAATGSVTEERGGYTVAPVASTVAAIEIPISGSSPGEYVVGFDATAISDGYWPFGEIVLIRTVSGRAITFGIQGNNGQYQWIFGSKCTRPSPGVYTYSSGLGGQRYSFRDPPRFLRVYDDGTNLRFYVGWGTSAGPWELVPDQNTTRADWLGGAPDYIGFASYSGATYLNTARLLHWTYTA